jgi:Cys-rich protein (TIGR01571 family)
MHFGLWWVLPMINRSNMRERYDLKGSLAKDFFCAFCCLPCNLTQQAKEVKLRASKSAPTAPMT